MQSKKEGREATADLRAHVINMAMMSLGRCEPETTYEATVLSAIAAILPTVQQNACLLEEALKKLDEALKKFDAIEKRLGE